MSRYPDKEMLKSWGSYDTTIKLCKHAHTKGNVRRYQGLLNTLQTTFYKFDEDWRLFKDDAIKKMFKTEDAFNAETVEEGVTTVACEHNDKWFEEQFERFTDTRDMLEDVLDQTNTAAVTHTEEKAKDVELAVDDIRAEFKSLQTSVARLKSEIESHDDQQMQVSEVMGYENIIVKLLAKIEGDLRNKVEAKLAVATESIDSEYSNAKIRTKFGTFAEDQKTQLNTCSMILVRKSVPRVEEQKPSITLTEDTSAPRVDAKPREQVYLEKTKPPKLSGVDLDFLEFKSKWLSQVNKANWPEKTNEAFKILTKRYGSLTAQN